MSASEHRREYLQARRNSLAARFGTSLAIKSWDNAGPLRRASAGLVRGLIGHMAGAPATASGLERSNSRLVARAQSNIEALGSARESNNLKLALVAYGSAGGQSSASARRQMRANAPALVRYAKTEVGREAIVRILSERQELDADDVSNLKSLDWAVYNHATTEDRRHLPGLVLRAATAHEDGLSLGRQKSVKIGDVDIAAVFEVYSRMTAEILATHPDNNFEVMLGRKSSNPRVQQVARDYTEAFAGGIDSALLRQAFDPVSRHPLPLRSRIMIAQGFQANRDVFAGWPLKATYASVMAYLDNDPELTMALAHLAGTPVNIVNSLSFDGNVLLARKFMNGGVYKPAVNYNMLAELLKQV